MRPTSESEQTLGRNDLLEILAVYDSARSLGLEDFEQSAMRRLGAIIGFDGAVWGTGSISRLGQRSLVISRARVIDRSDDLLEEYAEVAHLDPVTARFLNDASRPDSISVSDYYACKPIAPVGEYLNRHRIEHLVLTGMPVSINRPSDAVRWVTAYRESGQPFSIDDIGRLSAMLPFWMQAYEMCAQLNLARLARHGRHGMAFALCDRRGTVHAAEGAFFELTGRTLGDRMEINGAASDGIEHAPSILCDGNVISVFASGPWLLLGADLVGPGARLTQRERQVARSYVNGLSYKEVALAAGSSPATVRTQLQSIFLKLGVHSRMELMRVLDGHHVGRSAP